MQYLKKAIQYLKQWTFIHIETGEIAAIHSLPGICTVHCLKGYRFSRPKPVIPGQGEFVSDIPAVDGKIGNLFYSVYAVRVHAPSSKN
jgi:hypothetical protein